MIVPLQFVAGWPCIKVRLKPGVADPFFAMVDTGASLSLFDRPLLCGLASVGTASLTTVTGTVTQHTYRVDVLLPECAIAVSLLGAVADIGAELPFRAMLGRNFLRHFVLTMGEAHGSLERSGK